MTDNYNVGGQMRRKSILFASQLSSQSPCFLPMNSDSRHSRSRSRSRLTVDQPIRTEIIPLVRSSMAGPRPTGPREVPLLCSGQRIEGRQHPSCGSSQINSHWQALQ